jgi:hypothetical protein
VNFSTPPTASGTVPDPSSRNAIEMYDTIVVTSIDDGVIWMLPKDEHSPRVEGMIR